MMKNIFLDNLFYPYGVGDGVGNQCATNIQLLAELFGTSIYRGY